MNLNVLRRSPMSLLDTLSAHRVSEVLLRLMTISRHGSLNVRSTDLVGNAILDYRGTRIAVLFLRSQLHQIPAKIRDPGVELIGCPLLQRQQIARSFVSCLPA